MLRILTWNSHTGFEKMPSEDLQLVGHAAQPPITSCKDAPAKRKRSFDRALLPERDNLAVKSSTGEPDQISQASVPHSNYLPSSSHVIESSAPVPAPSISDNGKMDIESKPLPSEKVKSREEARLATMRQTISSQLSLEILLKHRELRLIDQELAKCQVALEQLRRCSEIPFPALHQPCEQVSAGKGPVVRKSSERHPARSPAPWGVTDGPYTRHYSRWLLPDSQFDGGEPEMAMQSTIGSTPFHGRSTRGHFTDFAQMVGKTSRSQRALNAGLPPGYAEPKQKPTGPMILKRKSDGKMVKLVCPDCGRLDFGSAQGFINHCRIGHQRNFASHDAAAEGCGEAVEFDENGAMKGVPTEPATPITPTFPTMSVPVTPLSATPISNAAVNPLVRSAHLTSKDIVSKPIIRGGYVPKSERKSLKAKASASSETLCSQTPYLATLVQKRGLDTNLQAAVTEAKMKVDLLEEHYDDEMEVESPVPTPTLNSRHPQVAGSKQPVKSTDNHGAASKSNLAQHRNVPGSFSSVSTDAHFRHFMPLVPSPTNESTQAPSLIDDDEEMDPASPPSSDEIDDSDVHFNIRDDEHLDEAHELRGHGHEMPAPATSCTQPTAPSQQPLARPPSAKNNGQQLRFVAEHPGNPEHNDKKRRKIGD